MNIEDHMYLNNTLHYPPLDNQGEILSCTSQAITYIQFTNAVSNKMNDSKWQPSSMPSACFSPRFTYLLAGSSPKEIYNFIKDHGCLTLDNFSFAKDGFGGSIEYKDNKLIEESVSWNVQKNTFKNALKYRVANFEHISIHDLQPEELIYKIKQSINRGNVVVSTTSLENWIMSELPTDCGKFGKKGETIVIASRRYIPSGHSFAIVGYDDDIIVDFAGINFKGAFLVTCGYGNSWQNNGYNWLLYDAVYPVSKHEKMNNKDIYGGKTYFTLYHNKTRIFSPSHLTKSDVETYEFKFTPIGRITINNCELTKYYIQEVSTNRYLSYDDQSNSEFPSLVFSDIGTKNSIWCVISYNELSKWDTFNANYNCYYDNSYWIFSINLYKENSQHRCFLDSGLNFYDIGRVIGLSRFNNGNYPQAKSWLLNNISEIDPFITSIAVCSENDNIITRRTYSLKDFWLLDWNKDIIIGLPKLMVDIELETIDRNAFKIDLIRYDENGNLMSYTPEMFKVNYMRYVNENNYISFSGKINSIVAEKGFFTFQYSDLLMISPEANIKKYIWGIRITATNNHDIIINSIDLVNNDNEILSSIDFSSGFKTIKNETIEYTFDSFI